MDGAFLNARSGLTERRGREIEKDGVVFHGGFGFGGWGRSSTRIEIDVDH